MSGWKKYTYKGVSMYLTGWAKALGMSASTLRRRIDNGWTLEDALTKPLHDRRKNLKPRRVDYSGKRYGKLTVVKCVGVDVYGKSLWLCVCNCGGTRIVSSSRLLYTKSCGCARTKRRSGQKNVQSNQPCWSCQNYIDGCSWARKEHLPVEGWDATPVTKFNGNGAETHTYCIHSCPEYVSDGTEGRE